MTKNEGWGKYVEWKKLKNKIETIKYSELSPLAFQYLYYIYYLVREENEFSDNYQMIEEKYERFLHSKVDKECLKNKYNYDYLKFGDESTIASVIFKNHSISDYIDDYCNIDLKKYNNDEECHKIVEIFLSNFLPIEEKVLRLMNGIESGVRLTIDEIAHELGLTKKKVSDVVKNAVKEIKLLSHSSNPPKKNLFVFLDSNRNSCGQVYLGDILSKDYYFFDDEDFDDDFDDDDL